MKIINYLLTELENLMMQLNIRILIMIREGLGFLLGKHEMMDVLHILLLLRQELSLQNRGYRLLLNLRDGKMKNLFGGELMEIRYHAKNLF